jgi:hypothetical protein
MLSAGPSEIPANMPTPLQQPSPRKKATNFEPWIIAACAFAAVAAGIAVFAWLRKRKTTK